MGFFPPCKCFGHKGRQWGQHELSHGWMDGWMYR